jgi:hypothetical protein
LYNKIWQPCERYVIIFPSLFCAPKWNTKRETGSESVPFIWEKSFRRLKELLIINQSVRKFWGFYETVTAKMCVLKLIWSYLSVWLWAYITLKVHLIQAHNFQINKWAVASSAKIRLKFEDKNFSEKSSAQMEFPKINTRWA